MQPMNRRSFVATGSAALALTALAPSGATAATGSDIIGHRHNVLFNFNDDISKQRKSAIFAQIRELMQEPQVKGYYIARNILPAKNDLYREWFIIVDFENADTAKMFFDSEAHKQLLASWAPWPGSYHQLTLLDSDDPTKNIAKRVGFGLRRNILVNFQDDLPVERREVVLTEFKKLMKQPQILNFSISKSNQPDSKGYPFQYQFLMDFKNEETSMQFTSSPAHDAFAKYYAAGAYSDILLQDFKA
jgi:uncharacterized protein (DUF1330 family)